MTDMSADDRGDNVVSLDAWRNARASAAAIETDPQRPRPREWLHTTLATEFDDASVARSTRDALRRIGDIVIEYVEALESASMANTATARQNAIAVVSDHDARETSSPAHGFVRPALDRIIHAAARNQYRLTAAAFADIRSEIATPAASWLIRHGLVDAGTTAIETNAINRLEFAVNTLDRVHTLASAPARWALARSYFAAGHSMVAIATLERALPDLEHFDLAAAGSARLDAARILQATRSFERAEKHSTHAARILEALGDAEGVADALHLEGTSALASGRHQDAARILDEAAACYHELGAHHVGDKVDVARAQARLAHGDLGGAEAVLSEIWRSRLILDPTKVGRLAALPRVHAELATALDRPAAAATFRTVAEVLEGTHDRVGPDPDRRAGPVALGALAFALEAGGEPQLATDYWLAAAYATNPVLDPRFFQLGLAGYRRAALEAGYAERHVDTVAGRVAQAQFSAVRGLDRSQ